MIEIDDLLRLVRDRGASDLHVKVGSPPAIRIANKLAPLEGYDVLTPSETDRLARSILSQRDAAHFDAHSEADFAYSLKDVGRFRVNVFRQRGTVGLAMRLVNSNKSPIEELGLPPVVLRLADEPRGMILVTGTAGSGKTTTLASMVDHINRTREGHIITMEDPIEVLHDDIKCIVNQREVGIDVDDYQSALRHVVRQDPDVILIGEMRDHETVGAAMTAAEIGNLVFSTLHTVDATETVNRIIDFFPPHQQQQVRIMLASTLRGIVSMRLLPRISGGLVPAVEVMVVTGTIRECIVDAEQTYRIRDVVDEGSYYGMQTFDQSLITLYKAGEITLDDAVMTSANAHDFRIKLRALGIDTGQRAFEPGTF